MAHFITDVAQLWVFWLAIAGTAIGVATLIWHSRYENRRFDGWCDSLHVHPELIHSHKDGNHAHVHTASGERVSVVN